MAAISSRCPENYMVPRSSSNCRGPYMRNKRIVVVDDEANIGRSLQMILEHEGYTPVILSSSAEFRARGPSIRADAYLLDVRLPDGSGIDLLRSLRQNDSRTPVIMISGHAT